MQISIRLDDELVAALDAEAKRIGVGRADVIRGRLLAPGTTSDRGHSIIKAVERVEDVVNQILDFLPTLAVRGSQTGFSDGTPLPQIWEQEIEAQRVVATPLSAPTVPNLTPMRTVVTKTGSFEVPDVTPQDYDRVDPP